MTDFDWCAEALALRKVRRDLATGMAVSSVQHDDKTVSYTKADSARLDILIREADTNCDLASGKRKRRRFAKGARFRPY